MNYSLELTRNDLTRDPEERSLIIGKLIVSFNVKLSDKTMSLNTGNKFIYEDNLYEVMNKETIDSPDNYVKLNCVPKGAVDTQTSDKTAA